MSGTVLLVPHANGPQKGAPEGSATDLLTAWLDYTEARADITPATKVNYRRVIRNVLAWAGDAPMLDLRLHEYVHARRAAGIAERTIELELCVVRMAFLWAKEEHLIANTAHLRFPKLRIDRKVYRINHRTPTAGEAARVLEAMPDDDWKLALTLVARTGARVGEIISLRSQNLDEHRSVLALGASAGDAKTGLRWFPLDADSFKALQGRGGRGAAPMFDFGDVVRPKQVLRNKLAHACRDARVPEFTPHGLRRMVVGRLMRAGVDPGTAASLTGHSVNVMLRLYQEVTDEDRRLAAEKAALGVLVEPPDRS